MVSPVETLHLSYCTKFWQGNTLTNYGLKYWQGKLGKLLQMIF